MHIFAIRMGGGGVDHPNDMIVVNCSCIIARNV